MVLTKNGQILSCTSTAFRERYVSELHYNNFNNLKPKSKSVSGNDCQSTCPSWCRVPSEAHNQIFVWFGVPSQT
jgi:hypothetical protein